MTSQLALTLVCGPRSRRTDPETSRLAGEGYKPKQGSDCELVLYAVRKKPGLTYREIHALWAVEIKEPVAVMRRLHDLELAGLVRKGPAAIGPNGRAACTWFAVEGK